MSVRKVGRLELGSGESALVSGRGHLRVERGIVEILGGFFVEGSSAKIRPGKQFPVYSPDSQASVATDGSLSFSVMKGDPIPRSWRTLPDAFLTKSLPKLVALGPTDSGKSALTTYLVNVSLAISTRVGVIDGDPGQGDIGPPTCVSGAVARSKLIDLRELRPAVIKFTGVTSPSVCRKGCVSAISSVWSNILGLGVDFAFLNTDGWVDDGGLEHKLMLIKEINPDLVIALGLGDRCEEVRQATGASVICVDIPRRVLVRSPSTRYRARVSNILRHLRRTTRITLDNSAIDRSQHPEPGTVIALLSDGRFKSLGILDSLDGSGRTWAYCGTDSFDEVVVGRVSLPEVLSLLKRKELKI